MKRIKRLALFLACLSIIVCLSEQNNSSLIAAPPEQPSLALVENLNIDIDGEVVSLASDLQIDYMTVGGKKTATVNHASGVNLLTQLVLGGKNDSEGIYNLEGESLLACHEEYLGWNGGATFNQVGGVNAASTIHIGAPNEGSVYNLIAGHVSTEILSLGMAYQARQDMKKTRGVFNQKGGRVSVPQLGMQIGGQYGTGIYNLEGGELVAVMELGRLCPPGEKGIFNQYGGINFSSIKVGAPQAGSAFYSLYDGALISDEIDVGSPRAEDGFGEFNQSGGICLVEHLVVGGEGIYRMTGGILEIDRPQAPHLPKEFAPIYIPDNGLLDINLGTVRSFKLIGDQAKLVNEYIGKGRIIDSSLGAGSSLTAVYDPINDWTTIKAKDEIKPEADEDTALLVASREWAAYRAAVTEAFFKASESARRVETDLSILPGYGTKSTREVKMAPTSIRPNTGGNFGGSHILRDEDYKCEAGGYGKVVGLLVGGGGNNGKGAQYDLNGFSVSADSIFVGYGGKGQMYGGDCIYHTGLFVGLFPGSSGSYKSGQVLSEPNARAGDGSVFVGYAGEGYFNPRLARVRGELMAGVLRGSRGKCEFQDIRCVDTFVGYGGIGEIVVTPGIVDEHGFMHGFESDRMYAAFHPMSEGSVILKDGKIVVLHEAYIEYGGNGAVTQEKGAWLSSELYLGYLPGSTGTFNFNDGLIGLLKPEMWGRYEKDTSAIHVGFAGKGEFNQSGGLAQVGLLDIGPRGKFSMTGGKFFARRLRIDDCGVMDIDIDKAVFQMKGDKTKILTRYIDAGKIIDSAAKDQHALIAEYDQKTDVTTLKHKPASTDPGNP